MGSEALNGAARVGVGWVGVESLVGPRFWVRESAVVVVKGSESNSVLRTGGGGDAGKDGGISRVGGDGGGVLGKESPRDGDDLESRAEA